MKNKDRIEQLEKQVEVLANRVALLEMRTATKTDNPAPAAPAPMPTTWPSYQPNWVNTPMKYEPWHYQVTCNSTKH